MSETMVHLPPRYPRRMVMRYFAIRARLDMGPATTQQWAAFFGNTRAGQSGIGYRLAADTDRYEAAPAPPGQQGLPVPLRRVLAADADVEADAELERVGRLGDWVRWQTVSDISERGSARTVTPLPIGWWRPTQDADARVRITTRQLRALIPFRGATGVECEACGGEGMTDWGGTPPYFQDGSPVACSECGDGDLRRGTGRIMPERVEQEQDAGVCGCVIQRPSASQGSPDWNRWLASLPTSPEDYLGRHVGYVNPDCPVCATTGRSDGRRAPGEDYDGGDGRVWSDRWEDERNGGVALRGWWSHAVGLVADVLDPADELDRRDAHDTITLTSGRTIARAWVASVGAGE